MPRVGAAHDSAELVEYSSASAIRAQLRSGGEWRSLVSESTAEIISREMSAGRAPVMMQTCERAVLARLRSMAEEEFAPYDGGKEGLYRRFYTAVHQGNDVEAILSAAKTKRYPLARLRRFLLHSYLGVPQAQQGETPLYLRVLGATERGRGLLRQMRKCASLPVITKPADVRKLDNAAACTLFEQEARCTDLYTLAMPELANASPDSEFRCPAVMTGIGTERKKQ